MIFFLDERSWIWTVFIAFCTGYRIETRLNNHKINHSEQQKRINCQDWVAFSSPNFPHVFFENAGLWLDRLKCTKKRAHRNTKGVVWTKGRLFQSIATNFCFVSRQYLISVWCWRGFPGRKVLWRKLGLSC